MGEPAAGWTPLKVAVAIMILTYIWRVQQVFPALSLIKLTLLVSAAAIALFLMQPGCERSLVRLRHPVFKLLGVVLIWMVLSIPTSVYPGHSFRFLFEDFIKTCIFAALIALSVKSLKDVERFALVHIVGGLLFCIMCLVRDSTEPGSGRLSGIAYYDANDLGLVVLCTLPLVVHFILKRTIASYLLGIPTAIFFISIIAKTGSRGAFLGLVALGLYFLTGFKTMRRSVRIGITAAAAAALLLVSGAEYWEQMRTIVNPREDYNWSGKNEAGRMEIWKRGFTYMLQRPVTGVGAAAFAAAEGMMSEVSEQRRRAGMGFKWSAAHNSFVQIGAELGVPGLLFLIGLLLYGFRSARQIARDRYRDKPTASMAQSLAAIPVVFAISGFFLSAAYTAHLYAALGLIVGYQFSLSHLPEPRGPQQRVSSRQRRKQRLV